MTEIKIAIIGGTGINKIDIFQNVTEKSISTPFGEPSDVLKEGFIHGKPCVFLSRHGKNHSINPTNVNYRANLWALQSVGCTHVIAITACGGLQHHTKPGDLVVLDQFFDRTTRRIQTFYDGLPESPKGVLHIPMNEPFCERTRQMVLRAASNVDECVQASGTAVTIEGPRFSSKFESKYWNKMGASVINMTTVPEVILAKELGLCYVSLAMVTDYDSWLDNGETVDVQKVGEVMKTNAERVKKIVIESIKIINNENWIETLKKNKDLIKQFSM